MCHRFLLKIVNNGEADPRIVIDTSEFGLVMGTNLRLIIYRCLLSGYFNTKLKPIPSLFKLLHS